MTKLYIYIYISQYVSSHDYFLFDKEMKVVSTIKQKSYFFKEITKEKKRKEKIGPLKIY